MLLTRVVWWETHLSLPYTLQLATPLQGYTQMTGMHMYGYIKPGPNFLTPNLLVFH